MIVNLKNIPHIARIICAVTSGYRKHQAIVSAYTAVDMNGTAWDGGSRSSYYVVDIATGQCRGTPQYAPAAFGGPRITPSIALTPGVAVVKMGTFRGKTATAHVFVHPDDVAGMVPEGAQ